MDNRDWMTLDEAAELLKVDKSTVSRYIKLGKIKSFQFVPKGTHRISAASVNALLKKWSGNIPTE